MALVHRPTTAVVSAIRLLAVWFVVAAIGSGCGQRPVADQPSGFVVVEVIDGDTIEIAFGATSERVRLLGIDAPESVHPTVPVQCYGREASTALGQLLPAGTPVDLYHDQQIRDHFGRLLLYVYRLSDGLYINQHLVETGMAATSFYEPNLHHQPELWGAERRAKQRRSGLWGACEGPDQPLQ